MALGIRNRDEEAGWYVNATYKFPAQRNVSVVAEVGDTGAENTSPGFLAGVKVKF